MSGTTLRSYHGSNLMPALDHATVAEAMHPGIRCCDADATVIDVARLMATHRIHCVVVTHPAQDGSPEPYVWEHFRPGLAANWALLRSRPNRRGSRPAADHQRQARDVTA